MLDIPWVTPPFSLDWWGPARDITVRHHSIRASLTSPPHPPSLTTGFLHPPGSQAPAPPHGRGTSLTSGPFPGTTRGTWRPTTGRGMEVTPPPQVLRATSDHLVSQDSPHYVMECLSRVSTYYYISCQYYQSQVSLLFRHLIFRTSQY